MDPEVQVALTPVRVGAANFRLSAKNYWLTYSQIGDLDNQSLTNKLNSLHHVKGASSYSWQRLLPQPQIKAWAAAEEHHQDGGRHWHAFVMFHRKPRSRSPSFFDVEGIHPNIKTSAGTGVDKIKIWKYLTKEGFNLFGTWTGPDQDLTDRCGFIFSLSLPSV